MSTCSICGLSATTKHVCEHLDTVVHAEQAKQAARAKRRAHLIEEIIIHNPCVSDEECLAAVEQIMRLQDGRPDATLVEHLERCASELTWMIDQHNVQNMDDGSWLYDHQTPWEALQLVAKTRGEI